MFLKVFLLFLNALDINQLYTSYFNTAILSSGQLEQGRRTGSKSGGALTFDHDCDNNYAVGISPQPT